MKDTARKIPVLIVSGLLAASLWLYVRAQNALVVTQTFPVKLTAIGLGSDLIVTRIPATINVKVEGSDQDLRQVDEKRVSALVDLQQATPGINGYRVTIRPPTGAGMSLKWSLQDDLPVNVGIDRRVRRPFQVQVVKQGLPPDGIEVGDVLLEPPVIMLDGPETQLNLVDEVRATFDLSKVRAGETYQAQVEVFGKDKGPMPLITSDPSAVTLRPIVAAAPPSRSVLVSPSWKGQLAFGAEIVSYSITPNQIQLRGRREVLAELLTIRTQNIDLTGLRESRVLTVPLVVPAGVEVLNAEGRVVSNPTVAVRLNVRMTETASGSTTGGQ